MADYSKMTQEEFDSILEQMVKDNVGSILTIPGLYEPLSEFFNNAVLEVWAQDNPEKAYPEEESKLCDCGGELKISRRRDGSKATCIQCGRENIRLGEFK